MTPEVVNRLNAIYGRFMIDRQSDVRFGSKADMCGALANVATRRAREQGGRARQNHLDFGELARLRIDLD
jgi:hypothetical protein